MPKNDKVLMAFSDVPEAFVLLSRFPVRMGESRGILSAWAWPLVGLAVAVVGALVAWISNWLGLGPGIAAALALGAMTLSTGAMHDDGLADCADGMWGGHDPARRLEIMKDCHIGTYGVLALILSFVLQWQALSALFAAGHVIAPLVAAAVVSRAPMVAIMNLLEPARPGGLSGGFGRPSTDTMYLAIICALIPALLFAGFATIFLIACAAIAAGTVALIAKNKINGQTGDVLGAVQKITEIAVYLACAAMWA